MNKDQKEEWIVNRFIQIYNKDFGYLFFDAERTPTTVAAGPDFVVKCQNGEKIGIEVTELLDYPSEITGQQRKLQEEFFRLLNKKLDKKKFKGFSFSVYNTLYPKNQKSLEEKVDLVINAINGLNLNDVFQKGRKSFYVDGQKLTIIKSVERSSANKFVQFGKNRGRSPN